MADATNLEKKYIYKVSRSGVFLGVLPNVKSRFSYGQDINTAAVSLTIEVGSSTDRQFDAPPLITTEDSALITDETGVPLAAERQPDLVGNSGNALIRNNNTIQVYEISPDYPNGKLVFGGWISRWRALFGGGDNIIVNCLSNGTELDNYLILGSDTLDQSQTSQNTSQFCGTLNGIRFYQTFTVGAGVTQLSSIIVKLANNTVNETVDIRIMPVVAGVPTLWTGSNHLAVATRTLVGITATDYTFTFPVPLTVVPGQQYAIRIGGTFTDGIRVYYQNTDLLATGDLWTYSFSYGLEKTPGLLISTASDIYFKTYYTANATNSAFISQDPTAILRTIIDSYVNRGGAINYASGTTTLTGLSVSYTFKINTVLEGIKKCLELAPFDWYYYVDPATGTLYFKQTSTTADHKMIYGRHIQSLDVEASVEEVKTQAYFTGGDTGGNVYLYTSLSNDTALANNASRVGLERMTDNRVTLQNTALTLLDSFLDEHASEVYHTSISVNAKDYDITLFDPGETIGFGGFGSFVDSLILQIVHVERHDDYVVLGLGVIPQRASAQVEQIQRDLAAVQTIYNPSAPS